MDHVVTPPVRPSFSFSAVFKQIFQQTMRSTVLFSILIFALQSQASFLSRMLYKSGIYQSFFWPMSNIPLSIYHDTVEVINNEPLPSASSTNVDEPDDRQTKSESSQKQLVQRNTKNQRPKKNAFILRDSINNVGDARPVNTSVQSSDISQELSDPQVDNQFKTLIEKGEYEEIIKLGKEMNDEEFLRQLCPVVKTFEQYGKLFGDLKSRKMVISFYVHGDVGIVKKAINAGSKIYHRECYDRIGILEAALPLTLKEACHDRFIELLEVRKGITIEMDDLAKRRGSETSFERFLYEFLRNLAPWEGGIAFKRFLTTRDEYGDKHPDIFNTLCQELVRVLRSRHDDPKAKKFLIDLIGQPSLLPPLAFVDGFLRSALYGEVLYFIDCAWSEIIGRCLRKEYKWADDARLWEAIQKKFPTQFSGRYPDTEEAIAAVLVHFPTKQKLEDNWNKKF